MVQTVERFPGSFQLHWISLHSHCKSMDFHVSATTQRARGAQELSRQGIPTGSYALSERLRSTLPTPVAQRWTCRNGQSCELKPDPSIWILSSGLVIGQTALCHHNHAATFLYLPSTTAVRRFTSAASILTTSVTGRPLLSMLSASETTSTALTPH